MNKEGKTIEELLKEYYNRPLELIEENKKLKKKTDKLQKENKNLKICLEGEKKYSQSLNEDIKSLLNIEPNTNFISKDKIRTKIKELEEEQKKKKHISNLFGCANTTKYVNINNEREIKILKELLGEKTNEQRRI